MVKQHVMPQKVNTIKFSAKLFVPQEALSDGKSLDELYSIDFENDMIEEGSKSVVYKCIFKETGEERCVKIVEKSSWNDDINASIRKEIELLKKMDHPNIVRVFGTFEDQKFYYIVMDLCKGGELRDLIVRGTGMTEFYVAVLVKTILTAINYCFDRHQVVHLGIKPENIMLESHRSTEQLKLIDFGNSIIAPKVEKTDRLIGAAAYLSPESLKYHNYSHKTDIWAIGVMAYFGLSGCMPFEADTDEEVLQLILNSKEEIVNKDLFKEDAWAAISDDAIDFVSQLLGFEPFKRPSASDALQHPWIERVTKAQVEVLKKRDIYQAQVCFEEMFCFSAPNKLQQAALTYIASQCLSRFDKDPLERIYQAMDLGHKGKVSREDFKTAYAQYMGEDEKELRKGELRELFENVDLVGSGTIEYSEFLIASLTKDVLLTDDNIQKAFKKFDVDGDGKISESDLKQVLTELSETKQIGLEEYIQNKLLNGVETDDKGMITFDTFSELLISTKEGPGRDPCRRMSDDSSKRFELEAISVTGNVFDQYRSVFERNLKGTKDSSRR